ncbi:MAG: iron complex outermembrane receptor protein, partial [Saprospiraceae bacterium]
MLSKQLESFFNQKNYTMKNFLLITFLFFSHFLMGQTTVSGVVIDEDQEPLIGATVSVKDQPGGAITDISGRYTLDVNDSNATVVFSYIGFTSQEVALDGRSTVDVIMSAGLILNEVVFVGSRSAGRTKLTTAVPVDVIDVNELMLTSPQVNLNQILNYVAPSFTSNVQNIS